MSFSSTSGTCIIPTLSRLVLCAAFVPAGYNKVFNEATFTGGPADRLIELGVIDATPQQANMDQRRLILPVAFQDDPASDDAGATEDPPVVEVVAQPDSAEDEPQIVYTARAVHGVTASLPESWPAPVALAWVAALTELLGGVLILVGLFSRVWGLGLAIAMGVAFYLTTIPTLGQVSLWSMLPQANYMAFNTMFTQLALFVLAFGVFLTGAGPISLDRALFRKSADDDEDDDDEV